MKRALAVQSPVAHDCSSHCSRRCSSWGWGVGGQQGRAGPRFPPWEPGEVPHPQFESEGWHSPWAGPGRGAGRTSPLGNRGRSCTEVSARGTEP